MPAIMPRLCAAPNCDVDLTDERPNKLYCSDSCKQRAAYARSARAKQAKDRDERRRQDRLATTDQRTINRSMFRQMRRVKAKIRTEEPDAFKPLRPEFDPEDPLGFRRYRASTPKPTQDQIHEQLGWAELAGFVKDALFAVGASSQFACLSTPTGLEFITHEELDDIYRDCEEFRSL